MHSENLVKMLNNISAFFQADPDRTVAIQGVVEHVRKNWEPRMRRQIIAHFQAGGEGLSELSRAAVQVLVDEQEKAAA